MIRRVGPKDDIEIEQLAHALARKEAAYEVVHVAQAVDDGLHLFVVPDDDLSEFRQLHATAYVLWSYGSTSPLPAVLRPDSPCWTTITSAADGGQHVLVHIPTFDGGKRISVLVQRGPDGDWYVDVEGLDDLDLGDGSQLAASTVLGAPDEPTQSEMSS